MIDNFQDHAANERTFLSWVRTSVAIVGIGLVVANFEVDGNVSRENALSGLWMLIMGISMIFAAGLRFLFLRRLIRSEKAISIAPVILDMALVIVLILMIATVAIFGITVSPAAQ